MKINIIIYCSVMLFITSLSNCFAQTKTQKLVFEKYKDSLLQDYSVKSDSIHNAQIESINYEFKRKLEELKQKGQNELLELNNSTLFYTRWFITFLTVAFTIVFALSAFNIFNKNKEIKKEVSEFKDELSLEKTNLKDKIKEEIKEKERVNGLISKVELSIETNDENLKMLNEERIAFLDFNYDLIQFLDLSSMLISDNIKNEKISMLFMERLYEHGSILSLYLENEESLIKNCQYLIEKGTAKSVKHLQYIIRQHSQETDVYKSIDLALCAIKVREETA